MQQSKRHHFVPKAYLRTFCNDKGRLLVYRKDGPLEPLHVVPDATQFRRYYYSQPTGAGGQDNNSLEALFSAIESDWPETVARLHRREDVNDRLENIFQFISLQRVRVPANRDTAEAMLARVVKDTIKVMLTNGKLPPPPPGLDDLANQVQVTIDPHESIHAMASVMQGMSKLFSMMGLVAVHNATRLPLLTSDNPVFWFDPSLPFDEQLPYTINPNGGPVFLAFPVSPKLVLIGSNEYRETFGVHGLLHRDVSDETWVDSVNTQVCRFAYEAVIAQNRGQEDRIATYADVSPVHQAVSLQVAKGVTTIHRQVFGPRVGRPKWRTGRRAA